MKLTQGSSSQSPLESMVNWDLAPFDGQIQAYHYPGAIAVSIDRFQSKIEILS